MRINLKEIRKQQNLSKTKLSKLSGIALSYISEIESGKYKNPSATIICKLCVALNCTPNDLIDCKEGNDGSNDG